MFTKNCMNSTKMYVCMCWFLYFLYSTTNKNWNHQLLKLVLKKELIRPLDVLESHGGIKAIQLLSVQIHEFE